MSDTTTNLELAAVAWLRSRGYTVSPPSTACLTSLPETKERQLLLDSPEFTKFWAAYPRKENKASARKVWNKLELRLDAAAVITPALIKQVDAGMFSDDPKYIPMASTWLNQERWENPIVSKKQAKGTAVLNALDAFMED